MRFRFVPFLVIALMACGFSVASAQTPQHAIAMHGEPRYKPGFQHTDYVNPDAPKGGTLRRAEVGTFDNLNPFLITGRVTSGLQEALLLTYDSLMTRGWNEAFTMYGLVARHVTVSPKRDWIIFHLDTDARFHDGVPITADDVAFSHKTLMQYGRPNQRRIYQLVTKISITNKHTIRFDLGKGHDRETVMILANMPVLPKHYWADKEFGKTTLTPPMSSGPYRIKKAEAGRQVTFERVDDYWAKDKPFNRGLYNFDQLRYDFYRDDNAALQAFGAGASDLRREWSPVTWERDYTFERIKQGRIIKEEFKNGRPARARFMLYNMRRKPFDDIRVRQALAYAFDFEWLNKNLFLGTQKRIDSLFMNSELAYQGADKFQPPQTDGTGLAGLRKNLRHAITLLEEAGYTLDQGVLKNAATDQALTFEILLNDPNDEKVALEFARGLSRIGIKTTLRTVDTAQYIGRLSEFDFDMTMHFWRNSLSPGTEQAVYWGSAAADQQGSFNYAGVKSAEIDGLITRLTHAENRQGLVQAAQSLDHAVMNLWIGVPLYDALDDRVAYRHTLRHPEGAPLYGPVIESWWYREKKSGKEVSKLSPSK